MAKYYIFVYKTNKELFGFCTMKADNIDQAYQGAIDLIQSKPEFANTSVTLGNNPIVTTEKPKFETLPEYKDSAFDSLVNVVELIHEQGLDKFDQLRRQDTQRNFSKLLQIGYWNENTYLDRRILPSTEEEIKNMLRESK